MVAVDKDNNVYVLDSTAQIKKFTSTGIFVWAIGSYGSGDGQYRNVTDWCVDGAGNVYVVDPGNYRIEKFGQTTTTAVQHASWGGLKRLFR